MAEALEALGARVSVEPLQRSQGSPRSPSRVAAGGDESLVLLRADWDPKDALSVGG